MSRDSQSSHGRGRHADAPTAGLLQCFDSGEDDAFALAVKSKMARGLPLSLADRKRAASRIIASHPHWSDRMIASVAGLAARTVAVIRAAAREEARDPHARVGRDGRVRPLDATEGRKLALELMAANPGLSLREVAKAAGISPETVRDVRNKVARGENPLPDRHRRARRCA